MKTVVVQQLNFMQNVQPHTWFAGMTQTFQNLPSRFSVAEHVTIPAEFWAIHEYSPSCEGRTLEISRRQVSSK